MADKPFLLHFTFILLIIFSFFSLSDSVNFSSPNSTEQSIDSSGNFSHLTDPFQIQDLNASSSTPIIQNGYLNSSSQNQITPSPNCSTEHSVEEAHLSYLEDLSPYRCSDHNPEVIGSNLDEVLDISTVVHHVLNSSVQNHVSGSGNCLTENSVLEDPSSVRNSESFSSVTASNSVQEDEFSNVENFCRVPFSDHTPEVDGLDFDGERLDSGVDEHLTPLSHDSDLDEELDIFNGVLQSLNSSVQNQVPRSTNRLTENSFLEDPNSHSNSESFSPQSASNCTLEDEASNLESHVPIQFSDYTPRFHDSELDEEPLDSRADDHFSNLKSFSDHTPEIQDEESNVHFQFPDYTPRIHDSEFDEEPLNSRVDDHFSSFKSFSDHTPEIQDEESNVHIHFSDYTPRIHDSEFDEERLDSRVDDHFTNFKTSSDYTPEIKDSDGYKRINTCNGVSQMLNSSGYTKLATFLDKHLEAEYKYQGKLTIFAPLYRNINQFSARNFSEKFYSTVFKAHIVADWLPWKDLVTMKSGTEFRTFLGDGHEIRVTSSVDTDVVKVNGVRVIAPDMYCSERLVVHGIENVLVYPS